jgi:molybdate transport system substrate-binding protein
MKYWVRFVSSLVLALLGAGAQAQELVVYCAGAVRPALDALRPAWAAHGPAGLDVTFAPAGALLAKLAAGGRPDVVILPSEALSELENNRITLAAGRRDLGAVGIGIAVAAGAPLPDVSTEDALRRTLVAARSVTFMDPTRGTSGRHVDEVVLPRLGIRDAVRAKTVLGEGGMIGEKVARGEAELVFQQMTELIPVPGIRIAGPLPASLQKVTVYAGAVSANARAPEEAARLLTFLVSPAARAVFAEKGFGAP